MYHRGSLSYTNPNNHHISVSGLPKPIIVDPATRMQLEANLQKLGRKMAQPDMYDLAEMYGAQANLENFRNKMDRAAIDAARRAAERAADEAEDRATRAAAERVAKAQQVLAEARARELAEWEPLAIPPAAEMAGQRRRGTFAAGLLRPFRRPPFSGAKPPAAPPTPPAAKEAPEVIAARRILAIQEEVNRRAAAAAIAADARAKAALLPRAYIKR